MQQKAKKNVDTDEVIELPQNTSNNIDIELNYDEDKKEIQDTKQEQ